MGNLLSRLREPQHLILQWLLAAAAIVALVEGALITRAVVVGLAVAAAAITLDHGRENLGTREFRNDRLMQDRLYTMARELGPVAADTAELGPALSLLRRELGADIVELSISTDTPGVARTIAATSEELGGVTISESPLNDLGREAMAFGPYLDPSGGTVIATVPGSVGNMGVLTVRRRPGRSREFGLADLEFLRHVAEQLGAAIERGRTVVALRLAATRDSLTALANLDTLRSFLTTMLGTPSTGGVLLLLDLDRFHEINDTLGHDAGDAVLIEVARRLAGAPTHGALVARIGGDQFALAIPGQVGREVARLAALAVKARIDGPLRFDAFSVDLRVTIGMARAPEHGGDAATLLRRAEMAMTDAKGSSSGIGEWEPGLERDGSRRLQVLAGLRHALANNELRVEFQPKIQLGSGEVVGFETLVRWRHPELGPVSPAEFVPIAEASGLISALTSNVLRLSLDACRSWHDMGWPVGVAVNISARSLDDPVLVGQVAAMLTASAVEPRWLTIEITEGGVMENPARSLDMLLQLRSVGVRLSIDDFGTGYSSLHQLRRLPVHEVKIDKALVDHIDGDGADRAVVRAVVELCDSLGLTTVAEGVDQATQAYALETLGVAEVQGYFYGRPMSKNAATDWLMSRRPARQDHPRDVTREP